MRATEGVALPAAEDVLGFVVFFELPIEKSKVPRRPSFSNCAIEAEALWPLKRKPKSGFDASEAAGLLLALVLVGGMELVVVVELVVLGL